MRAYERQAALLGHPGGVLDVERVEAFVADQLQGAGFAGRSVCVLVPDATRSCPLPFLLRCVHRALYGRVSRLTVLIALGTHAPMDATALAAHLGYAERGLEATYPGMTVENHAWWEPTALTSIGVITAEEVRELSEGRLDTEVVVRLNRAVVEHDDVLVVGPVFPHEVVGFSGGNKYLFPGVAGQEIIDLSHWLGALISNSEIIGTLGVTPVRALIDRAAALVPGRRLALSAVVASGTPNLHAVAFGSAEASWRAAAQVSAEVHIRYLPAPVRRVLSIVSPRYDEIWTAAKGIYKVEPIVADGGQVVLYAPHVRTISHTHGREIARIGYHCRDYFTAQWARFRDEPWGVLAHSTHVRGGGTYTPADGERCRIGVTLATGIDEATTRGVGLDFLDPATINIGEWEQDAGTFVIRNAGEVLYRLRPGDHTY